MGPKSIAVVSNILHEAGRCGIETYVFGGFVRDTLVGHKPKDIDIIVKCSACGKPSPINNFNQINNLNKILMRQIKGKPIKLSVKKESEEYAELACPDEGSIVGWDLIRLQLDVEDETVDLDVIFQPNQNLFYQFNPDYQVNRLAIDGTDLAKFTSNYVENVCIRASATALMELGTRILNPVPGMSEKRKAKIPHGFRLKED